MIELAEVIGQLREELERARDGAAHAALRFELGPVELELEILVEKQASAQAKVKFWVAETGLEGRLKSSSTQRITLTLNPTIATVNQTLDQTGQSTSPVSVYIEGKAVPGER